MEIPVLILLGYLIGSVPNGYLLGKLAGVDIQKVGSGNIGAANVARTLGKWQGALTLVADAAKGFLPVFVALELGLSSVNAALVAIAAFLGHLYPVFLKFRGGKGVATGLGALLALAPLATVVLIAIFAAVALSTRLVSLSSIAAAVAAPVILWLFNQQAVIVGLGLFFGAMITLRHRRNIRRILAGTEPRFGSH